MLDLITFEREAWAQVRATAVRFGFFLLDMTTRTWFGFWGTIVLWVGYQFWNAYGPPHYEFDQYPFTFLVLLITEFSYLQNIVIMTDQRVHTEKLAILQEKQAKQDQYMLELMETNVRLSETTMKFGELLIIHAEKAEVRDKESIIRDTAILDELRGIHNRLANGAAPG